MSPRSSGPASGPGKVAIIGAGLSGLSAGILLARRGFDVDLYEASGRVGGSCSATWVDGFRFHDGAISLALPRLLDAGFARLGLDRAKLAPLRRIDGAYTATVEDSCVTVTRGRIRLERRGNPFVQTFDTEVERFVARWRPVVASLTGDLLLRPPSLLASVRHLPQLLKLGGTAGDELRRSFRDPCVQAALAGFLLYAGLPVDRLPAASVLGLAAFLDEGFYLPIGGMSWIPAVLADAFETHGGRLHLFSPVDRVIVDDRRANGVVVRGRGRTDADCVVSTVTGMATFRHLLAEQDVPAAMRRKTARAPLSHSAICVQLGLRNHVASEWSAADVPMIDDQHRVFAADEADRWLNWSVPTRTAPELAPPGGTVIEMFSPAGRNGHTTQSAIDEQADRVIAALARRHRLDIAVRRVRGPREFSEQMGLFEGTLYGLSPAAGLRALYPHRTPVRGLYQSGQTTYPGYGVATSVMSGVLAAEALVEDRQL